MNFKLQLEIIRAMELKPNFSELARTYGVDRRTAKKYYEGYEGKPTTRNKSSKLDGYKETISEKLQIKGVNVKAVYEYFIDKQYDIGSYSNFLKYITKNNLKPQSQKQGHPRFETPLGKQAQADWKEDLKLTSRHGEVFIFNVFSYKLGNSRYCNFEYSKNRTQQDVFSSLIASFKATGGVPKEILFDNMRSVVDIVDKRRRINTKAQAFAKDFGFNTRLCKVRRSYTKGKVETSNKFIDWLLAYNNDFEDEEELKGIIKNINKKVNQNVSQATGVPPLLLFQKEKEYLQPLPHTSIIESYLNLDSRATVQKDALVYYKKRRYSVSPGYIGKEVTLREEDSKLHIYYNTDLISVHNLDKKLINYRLEDYKSLMTPTIKNEEDLEMIVLDNLSLLDNFLGGK